MKENTILLRGDGNIVIQDAQHAAITINTNDPADISHKIRELSNTQIAALNQLADEKTDRLSDTFKTLLRDVVSQKNIVYGNICGVQYVRIGDEIHLEYHTEKARLPKGLSAKIPRMAPDKIVGRDADLDDLHQRLFSNRQVVLLNGLGGIGKTTVAQVYVAKYWDEYRHVAWIDQTSEDIINDFVNTEGLLDHLNISADGKEAKALFIHIMTGFKKIEDQPNLLIIDNAESALSRLYEYLPAQPLWHILVTSRRQIPKFDVKELDFLSEDEAIELFLSHYALGTITRKETRELVTAVDLHTLTIEILARTAQTRRTEISQLKQAIADDLRANVYVEHKGGKIERVTSYLCSIFTLSRLSGNELWLLKQFTCLPPEFHNYDLLKELLKPQENQKEAVFPETIEALSAAGWLLKNQATDSYKMHRILADVIKKQLPMAPCDVASVIESVTGKLHIDRTKDNPVDKFPWIPFGKSVLDNFAHSELADISRLQNNLATVLKDLGDYEGAKNLFEKAMRSDEKNFGPDHPTTAVRYSNLALVLKALGDYEGAKNLLEKAMRSDEKNFGPDHPNTARSYSNLALVLKDLGDYEGAKNLLENAMRSDEKNFGPDHPNTAVSYSNLALVLQDLGDYEGAKNLLEKAMQSDEKNFGPDHPNTAVRYSNLALVLKDLGDYEGAKNLLENAMRSNEKNFGPDHPATAVRYSNLALVLKDLGDYEGAKNLLEKAMRSDEKNFGPDHPNTAVRYSNLALVLHDLGDYEKALELSGKSLRIFQNVLPQGHPNIKIVSDIYESIKNKMHKQ